MKMEKILREIKNMIKSLIHILFKLFIPFITKIVEMNSYLYNQARGEYILKNLPHTGNNVKINGPIQVIGKDKLYINDHVRIGSGCFLFCRGGLKIGKNTQISRKVTIYTANHDYNGNAIPYDDKYIYKPVDIGESVWIGMNVCITPGTKIGDGAIIGMGTTVSSDVPKGAIVVGQKARIIGKRNMKKYNNCLAEKKLFGKLWPDI